MGTNWTPAQQTVIDLRDKNILVSAAAGSGKTAVLVERIIQMVTDSQKPVDIDKLLVVTFTQAAASEMRERILNAIEKKVMELPDDAHLQKQLAYIHSANISTIHSFCLNLIKENFTYLDIDPMFSLADESELTLIKADAIKEVLEKYYEKKTPEFIAFIEKYSTSRSDKEIEKIIFKLFNFAMSYPEPINWLESCDKRYNIDSLEDMKNSEWMQIINKNISHTLLDLREKLINAKNWINEPEGPYMYEEVVNDEFNLIEQIINENDFDKKRELLLKYNPLTLSSKRDEKVDKSIREIVKNYRNEVKDGLKKLRKDYFQTTLEEQFEYMKNSEPTVRVLIELTKDFIHTYNELKKENNRLDFNDLEHLALNILVTRDENGEFVPTKVADEIAMQFEEIMIDEYQDSNFVQELLLSSISRERFGKPNVFMVGDVKQSIYKFRLARPELFINKYNTYTAVKSVDESRSKGGSGRRIILDRNFRSRNEIIVPTNFIFKQVMNESVGGIIYDEENYLYPGAKYPEIPDEQSGKAEFILVETKCREGEEDLKLQTGSKLLEAQVVANRIKELVSNHKVYDKETDGYRACRYSDIVILSRSVADIMDLYTDIFTNEGIPIYCDNQKGFFNATEVVDVLNMLRIIDNPRQDIPFVAVLTSAMFGITNEELAKIRGANKKINYYEAIWKYIENGTDIVLINKLDETMKLVRKYREMVPYTSIYKLITQILDDTGYYNYISALPGGKRRKANLDMLKEKSVDFEKGIYKGLFNFIRYIEKIEQYEIESGEASVVTENDNSVRLMTIHKSKGLEFPVVFVVSMGKQFNRMDYSSKLVLHPDLGIGIDSMDHVKRLKSSTLIKKAIIDKMRVEDIGEELRVFYVALTRAKEKLIMTATVGNMEKLITNWLSVRHSKDVALPYEKIITANKYSDIVGFALARNNCFKILLDRVTTDVPCFNIMQGEESGIDIKVVTPNDIVIMQAKNIADSVVSKESFKEFECDRIYDKDLRDELENRLNFIYQHDNLSGLYSKMSVSEIKQGKYDENEKKETYNIYDSQVRNQYIPSFISGKKQLDGAFRGTAFHRVFELFDYSLEPTEENYTSMLEGFLQSGKIDKNSADVIIVGKLIEFAQSELGLRMKKAYNEGKLKRETKFVMGVSAREIDAKYDSDEKIIVQGIIDAFFMEGEEIVLVDYKTDYVEKIHELVEKYRVQLDCYEEAIEKITGIKVKEKIIYSVHLSESINIGG
ncbi:MAG: helicase-exonuclease AddAB subunit AddA [Lachnospiraceae bacterium]|nr:helicase-exonuclease AddAB subunit AddA [Lachnospiraceae bacterium]